MMFANDLAILESTITDLVVTESGMVMLDQRASNQKHSKPCLGEFPMVILAKQYIQSILSNDGDLSGMVMLAIAFIESKLSNGAHRIWYGIF